MGADTEAWTSPRDVLDAWTDAGPQRWFSGAAAFDETIRRHGAELWAQAAAGGCAGWERRPADALALVIVLDQFPRNMFRDSPRAYATDAAALAVAERAIERRLDARAPAGLRRWLYMPFMHAEDLKMQRRGVELFSRLPDDPGGLAYAVGHMEIIERFGRFPHRNAVLGRKATAAEEAFLAAGGFGGQEGEGQEGEGKVRKVRKVRKVGGGAHHAQD